MPRMLIASAAALLLLGGSSAVAQSSNSDRKITLVGCVERADQVLAREDLGTTVDSLSFVLMRASEPGAKPSGSNASDPNAKDVGKVYRLSAGVDTLNVHVGHKVEIAGTMAAVGTAGSASNGGTVGVGTPPMVRVQSVKMLAATCGR
jgi:hypothetical protein